MSYHAMIHIMPRYAHAWKVTVNMAPMLCILFVGARLRALELDPHKGSPQKWAQQCMFLCTWVMLVRLEKMLRQRR